MVDHLKKLTEDYIDKTNDLLASRKLGEGFFGMPDSAKSHPCHSEFFNAVEKSCFTFIPHAPAIPSPLACGNSWIAVLVFRKIALYSSLNSAFL